ncbi:MAG: hypothetical protein HQK96_16535 [Nitrospirae bacterium]|nr:hypothetical protein [Nitrospirota bacterium]
MTNDELKPIREILEKHSIDKIAVIDDEFNLPKRRVYEPNVFEEFVDYIKENDKCLNELKSFLINVNKSEEISPDSISDNLLEQLWNKRDDLDALKMPCEKFFFNSYSDNLKNTQMNKQIVPALEALFGKNVLKYHEDVEAASIGEEVVLIDYYLGDPNPPGINQSESDPPSVIKSTKIALEIFRKSRNKKPTIILISHLKEDQENLISSFIEKR